MITKFIDDTNQQYSIREDGNVISHYRKKANGVPVYNDIIVATVTKGNSLHVRLYVNNKLTKYTISTLLQTYFNFYYCIKCNCRVHNLSQMRQLCASCKKENQVIQSNIKYANQKEIILERNQKWRMNNIDKVKELSKKTVKHQVDNITRTYVSRIIDLPMHELTDELYEITKKRIQLNRQYKQLKTQQNGNN